MVAHEMWAADIVRHVLVSLVALIVGMVVFGAWQAWRDKNIPIPRKMPPPVTTLFVVGYIGLLIAAAWSRVEHLGEGKLSAGAYLTLLALFCNVIAIALSLYYRRNMDTASLSEIREHDPGILGTILRWKIFKSVLDDRRFEQTGGGLVHPGRRAVDRMSPQQMLTEATNFVKDDCSP